MKNMYKLLKRGGAVHTVYTTRVVYRKAVVNVNKIRKYDRILEYRANKCNSALNQTEEKQD